MVNAAKFWKAPFSRARPAYCVDNTEVQGEVGINQHDSETDFVKNPQNVGNRYGAPGALEHLPAQGDPKIRAPEERP